MGFDLVALTANIILMFESMEFEFWVVHDLCLLSDYGPSFE